MHTDNKANNLYWSTIGHLKVIEAQPTSDTFSGPWLFGIIYTLIRKQHRILLITRCRIESFDR